MKQYKKAITMVMILLLVILIPAGIYLYKINMIKPEQRVKDYTKGLLKAYRTLDIKDIKNYVAKEQYFEDQNQLDSMKKENIIMIAKIDRQVVADREIKGNQAQVKMSENWTYHFVNTTNNKEVEADRDVMYFITYKLQKDFFKGWQIIKTEAISYDLGYSKDNKNLKYNAPPAKIKDHTIK